MAPHGAPFALQHSATHSHKIPKAYNGSDFLRATQVRHGTALTFDRGPGMV
jgi:hypothetical protein